MSRITREDVERTAELARLSLSDDEVEAMTHDLGRILDHVDQLQGLDTEGIEPVPLPAHVLLDAKETAPIGGGHLVDAVRKQKSSVIHRNRCPISGQELAIQVNRAHGT